MYTHRYQRQVFSKQTVLLLIKSERKTTDFRISILTSSFSSITGSEFIQVHVLCDVLVDPNFLDGVKKVFMSGEARDLVDPYLTFSFGGVKVSFRQQQHGHILPREFLLITILASP